MRSLSPIAWCLMAALSAAPAFQSNPTPQTAPRPLLAEDVYKNVEIFRGKEATRLLPAMKALTGLVGVECSYCHVVKEWEKDDKPAKPTTRKMFTMQGYINDEHFAKENKVSCWTCHAGQPKPKWFTSDPKAMESAAELIRVADDLKTKPAEQVFKNIQSLKGVPAEQFPTIMAFFAGSLGVPCTHCHVEGAYDKDDKKPKQTARRMLNMVTATLNKYYGGNGPIGCYTCHKGSTKPQLVPAGG